jgi:hypothetical protein
VVNLLKANIEMSSLNMVLAGISGDVMARKNYYKNLFRAAAIWSWLVSITTLVGNAVDEPIFRSVQPRVRRDFLLDMAVIPIFLFGFAFRWISLDLTRNHVIVAVGAAGGILALVSAITRAFTGEIPFTVVPAAGIDLIFGILVLEFLLWARRNLKLHDS